MDADDEEEKEEEDDWLGGGGWTIGSAPPRQVQLQDLLAEFSSTWPHLSWRRWTLRRSTSTWPSTSIRPTGWFLFSFSLTAELFFSVFRTWLDRRLGGHWAAAHALWWLEEGSQAHGGHFDHGGVAFQVALAFITTIIITFPAFEPWSFSPEQIFISRVAGAAKRGEGGLHGASHPRHAQRPLRGGEQGGEGGEFWEAVRLCREPIGLHFQFQVDPLMLYV